MVRSQIGGCLAWQIWLASAASAGPAARSTRPSVGAVAVASFLAAVLTEIYLCILCSCPEILRRNGHGQLRLGATATPPTVCDVAVRMTAAIEALCSPLMGACQRFGNPRHLNHRRV
jgi:hypothetical protein